MPVTGYGTHRRVTPIGDSDADDVQHEFDTTNMQMGQFE